MRIRHKEIRQRRKRAKEQLHAKVLVLRGASSGGAKASSASRPARPAARTSGAARPASRGTAAPRPRRAEKPAENPPADA